MTRSTKSKLCGSRQRVAMARLKRFSWQNFNLGFIAFALSQHLSEKFKALYRLALNLQLAAMRNRFHLRRTLSAAFWSVRSGTIKKGAQARMAAGVFLRSHAPVVYRKLTALRNRYREL